MTEVEEGGGELGGCTDGTLNALLGSILSETQDAGHAVGNHKSQYLASWVSMGKAALHGTEA